MTFSIPISSSHRCLLKNNQSVDFNTPFIEKETECEIEIPVAKILNTNPTKIFRYLTKYVGEKIEKKETIAVNRSIFSTKKVCSDYSGVIKEINHTDGTVLLLVDNQQKQKVNCFFKGKVDKIKKNEITIEVDKIESFPIKNGLSDFGEETFYLNKSSDLSSINISNKVIITDSLTSFIQTKIEALGAKGFVSLTKLPNLTELATVQIKNIDDYKKITKFQYPYCTVVALSSKIYFYQ